MSIEKFIRRVCVQTAVYWGNPRNDGMGGKTYDSPVEIPVRWDDKQQLIAGSNGKEITSDATVLVTQDLDQEGLLWLGFLQELNSNSNPPEDAREIKGREKVPMIRKTDQFVRIVYLSSRFR